METVATSSSNRKKSTSSTRDEQSSQAKSNNNTVLGCKSQAKETVSSRLRREMNAGKGVRNRSKTTESNEDMSDVSPWVKESLFEQKRTIKVQDDVIGELKKKIQEMQEKLSQTELDANECFKTRAEKEIKIAGQKLTIDQLQIKISGMEAKQTSLDNTVETLLKDIEGKNKEVKELREILQKERTENSSLVGQYTMTVQDRSEMNDTLKHEVDLLKSRLDGQQTSTNTMRDNFDTKLQEQQLEIASLVDEKTRLEKACQQYEIEISNRIKENLHIMDDYDNVKSVEHKQVNFINELTKSNQELNATVRTQENEISELKSHLARIEHQVNEEKNSTNETKTSLDQLQRKNENLEEAVSQYVQQIDSKDNIISRLTNQISELEDELQKISEDLQSSSTTTRQKYETKLQELEDSHAQIADDLQRDNKIFSKRDEEQTEFLNQLVKDLESFKSKLLEKTEMIHQLRNELTNEKKKHDLDNKSHIASTKNLEKQLLVAENNLASKTVAVDKLTNENCELNARFVEKLEMLEALKLEQNDNNTHTEHSRKVIDDLNEELTLTKEQLNDREKENEELRTSLQTIQQSNEQQGKIFSDLRHQNETLQSKVDHLQNDTNKFNRKVGECVQNSNNEIDKLNESHSKTLDNLRIELDSVRSTSQQEIKELLNNFNEVENELNLCQEELALKSRELQQAREHLMDMTKTAITKEEKLLKDLETLNEQNESILQSEIKNFKSECEEDVALLRHQQQTEVNKLRNEYEAKMISLKDEHAGTKAKLESVESQHEENFQQLLLEKNQLNEQLQAKSNDYTKIETDLDSKVRSKDAELTSKMKIIEQLGRRIETQQKLIDYMMKTLEVERSKHNNTNGDIMTMLANLQSTIDDKFAVGSDIFHSRTTSSLSSLSEETISSPCQMTSSFHPFQSRSQQAQSTSEVVISPLPSPNPSPVRRDPLTKEHFPGYLVSTKSPPPSSHLFNENHNETYLWPNSLKENLHECVPSESGLVDLGYGSPSTETNTKNTRTIYFGEQIQTIMKTFEKIENLQQTDTTPQNKELNLDIWKQKIHYRLKVLEDQMSCVDEEPNCAGIPHDDNNNTVYRKDNFAITNRRQRPDNNILFHPSTQEIRELIDNVNRRYQKLDQEY